MTFNNILKYIWPGGYNTNTPGIDIWEMDTKKHVFGYWTNRNIAGPNNPPQLIVSVPIVNEALEHSPDIISLYKWFEDCINNPERFTKADYDATFGGH